MGHGPLAKKRNYATTAMRHSKSGVHLFSGLITQISGVAACLVLSDFGGKSKRIQTSVAQS